MEFAICDENVKECPDGSNVSRDENNNCKFKDFPRTSSQSTHKGNDNDNNDSKVGKGARGKKKGHNDGRKKGKNKKKKGYEDDDDDDDLASTEVPSANNDDNDSNYMKKKGKKNNEGKESKKFLKRDMKLATGMRTSKTMMMTKTEMMFVVINQKKVRIMRVRKERKDIPTTRTTMIIVMKKSKRKKKEGYYKSNCKEDVFLCLDGTIVGRDFNNNFEFSPCVKDDDDDDDDNSDRTAKKSRKRGEIKAKIKKEK